MLSVPDDLRESFVNAVRMAGARPGMRDSIYEVYDCVRVEVESNKPACSASGRCCRFGEYGHKLFVTTAELGVFLSEVDYQGKTPSGKSRLPILANDACPYQSDRLCGVHPIRPLGCRLFYCDPLSTQWQQSAYERLHYELKRLHERSDVPYFYVEWLAALAAMRERASVSRASGF